MSQSHEDVLSKPAKSQNRVRRMVGIMLGLAVVAGILGIGSGFHIPAARAYSCTSPHCYGINDWPGGPIYGSETDISVAALQCNGCTNGTFIDDEMWLNGDSGQWVEAGYSTYTSHNNRVDYFWADNRACFACGYSEHDLGGVPSADFGSYTYFEIERLDGSDYDVVISSANFYHDGKSTSNGMTANDINIGSEIYGTSGAYAPRAYFIDNYWIDTGYHGHNQTANGTLHYNNPPYVGWNTLPSQSSTGGVLWTNT